METARVDQGEGVAAQQPQRRGMDVLPAALLGEALRPLDDGERRRVVDLGHARTATLRRFQGLRCRLGIAACLDDLAALRRIDDPSELAAGLARALPAEPVLGAEVLLAWDLADYLPEPQLRAVGTRMAELVAPGAVLHLLVSCGAGLVPAWPRRHDFHPDGGIVRALPGGEDGAMTPPRHGAAALEKALPHWRRTRSVLLRSGIEEHLLVRR